MNKNARTLILKAAFFLICLVFFDIVLGGINKYFFYKQKSGKYFRINYTMEIAADKILIFGDSHAVRHYVPDVIQNELHLSCYNAGVLGQGILFQSILQSIVLGRTSPEIIILDVDPNSLLYSNDQYDRLSDLNPFYSKYPDIIGRAIEKKSKYEKIFLNSKLYQFNSTIAHIIRYWVAPQWDQKGYRPLFGELHYSDSEIYDQEEENSEGLHALDQNMIEAFKRFAANAKRKNAKLVYVISPSVKYRDISSNRSLKEIKIIANLYNIPYIDFWNHSAFIHHNELFNDTNHLNDKGAKLFSKMVSAEIKKEFCMERGASEK